MLKLPYGHRNNTPGTSGWGHCDDTWLTIVVMTTLSLAALCGVIMAGTVLLCGFLAGPFPGVCYFIGDFFLP